MCHIMCILKILAGLCLVKQRIKTKSNFVNVAYIVLEVETFDRTQRKLLKKKWRKLGNSSISFKNYFKQLPAPFKSYADFECI